MNFGTMFGENTTLQTAPQQNLNIRPDVTANTPAIRAASVPVHLQQQFNTIMSTSLDSISNIGTKCGEEMGKLSDQVLQKVTMTDTGELGTGIKHVLALTQGVDLSKYGDQNQGFFGKLKTRIVGAKIDFMGQFNSTSTEIETIVKSLEKGLVRMKDDASWLQNAYDANVRYHNELKETSEAMEIAIGLLRDELQAFANTPDVDVNVLQGKQMYLDRMEKHHDKLLRLIQLAKLTAPEIRQMQMTNFNTVQTFTDLRDITIPSWKKTISLGLLSLQQKKDAEFSKSVQDAANDNLKKASDMINANMVLAAENANRSVVDMSTLEHVQSNMLNSLKQVQQIEEQGRQDRASAAIKLKQMEGELRNELLAISKR